MLPQEVLGALELRLAHAPTHAREAMLLEVGPDTRAVCRFEPSGCHLWDP